MSVLFDSQEAFWDEETSGESDCENFVNCANESKWIEMLLKIEANYNFKIEGRVLELGGGSQYISRFISERDNVDILCTDISNQRVLDFNNFYKTKPANFETMGHINASKLPFDDNSFDYIIGEAMLHHIEDLRSALLEINRCLKPNGRAIFIREPVIGLDDIILKRPIKQLLKKYFNNNIKNFIVLNRYEYDRTYMQWKQDFYLSGFICKFHQGWYNKSLKERFKSCFPLWYTSLVSFYIIKNIDLKQSDFQILVKN